MNPKVSIVVPIYNVEAYLERCLKSILSQELKEIEIIAVNDGSSDRSREILASYAKKDSRITVIDKRNGGVSSARNIGVELSTGEYIGFVDPDDWVEADMYLELYREAVQEDADIVMCTYIREFGTHSSEKKFDHPGKVCCQGNELRSKYMRRLIGPMEEEIAQTEFLDAWGTVWSKIYKAKTVKENRLTFTDLSIIGTNEDSLFNIQAFYYADTFVFLNRPYYHYWRANSNSVTSGYKSNLAEQWFALYGSIESFLRDKQMPEEFYTALQNRICLNTLGLGLNIVSVGNSDSTFQKMKNIDSFLRDARIRHAFETFEMDKCSAVWKVFFLFAKLRFVPGFYAMLLAVEWLRKRRK